MKRYSLVLILFCLIMFISSQVCAQPFKLGIPLPLTGSNAKFGEVNMRSYQIAAEEINAAGGVKGRKIVLEFEDTKGKPELARSIVERLIDVNKQPVIVGEYSSTNSKAVALVANQKKVPYLIVTGAADDITQNRPYVFRIGPANSQYSNGLMSFLNKVVKPRTVAILHESSEFGTAGAQDMVNQAAKYGIKVVLKEKYDKAEVDFRPLLSRIKAQQPDMIYMMSYVIDAALLMTQIEELQLNAKLFAGGGGGFTLPEFVKSARESAELVMMATPWSPEVAYPGAREYAAKYSKLYNDVPSFHGAEAYAALYVVKDALARAKSWSPEDIRAAMKATDMMTAFGPVKFLDKDGLMNQNFVNTLVMQVIKGRHETVWPEKSASAKYVYPIPRWQDRE